MTIVKGNSVIGTFTLPAREMFKVIFSEIQTANCVFHYLARYAQTLNVPMFRRYIEFPGNLTFDIEVCYSLHPLLFLPSRHAECPVMSDITEREIILRAKINQYRVFKFLSYGVSFSRKSISSLRGDTGRFRFDSFN